MLTKRAIAVFRFNAVRTLERIGSPELLYGLMLPVAALRAAFKERPAAVPLPACVGAGSVVAGTETFWRNYHLNLTLGFFPDRLAASKWLPRCSFRRLDELLGVQRRRQPAIIAVCHFGPFFLQRLWLQAAGIRAAALVVGRAGERSPLDRLKDRKTRFPEIPAVFHSHQMREVVKFLSAGNALVIAVDTHSEKQIEIPLDGGLRFRIATGALRLASRHRARLFPCNITDEGRWRFRLELGRPVPEHLLSGTPDFMAAGKHILDELLPGFRAHPEQCSKTLLASFQSAGQAKSRQQFDGIAR